METLKEIDAAEAARRKRAQKYQIAKDAAYAATGRLTNIQEKLKTPPPDLAPLQQIWKLAGDLPARYVTRGTPLVPGGQDMRHVIMGEVQAAIDQITRERKALEEQLPLAKKNAEEAEARLRSFETENAA
jgi:hypothetical protein